MSITLRQIEHVRAVAEHGHFGRAARAVHLSQPALTRSIQAVEDNLGVRLFDRGSKRVTPTGFGRLVLERGARLLADARRLEREIELTRGLALGEVSVGAGPYPAASLLPVAVGELASSHPALSVRVHIDNWQALADGLRRGEIEVFVADIRDLVDDADLDIRPLPRHRGAFVCRPGHPILGTGTPDLEAVRRYPLAGTTVPAAVGGSRAASQGPLPTPGVVCDDAFFLKALARTSDVIAMAPVSVVADELAAGELVELPVPASDAYTTAYGIVSLRGQSPSPAAEALVARLLEAEAGLPS